MTHLNNILANTSDFLYGYILIALLVLVGIFFTFKTKFVQITMIPEGIRTLTEKKSGEKGVSSFQALMISTASRVGTGNIAGVATALAAGGAGAIFWMWLLAVIGSASAFIESTLAQVYKQKDGETFRGGPAYYMQKALGMRWLGIIFAILLILCFAFGFNALQAFNVSDAVSCYVQGDQAKFILGLAMGIFLAIATAVTIYGGVHRIGIITSVIVPVMALLYICLGFFITLSNITLLPGIFKEIFRQAFDAQAIFGGFAGSCVMYGIKRGLFSNEAGMGSAPNAGATADVSHPVKQGLVQMISVYIDTLIICTTTAMMLLVCGMDSSLTGIPLVQAAIGSKIGSFGVLVINLGIIFFAFSSMIGNYCYAESNLKFIKDDKRVLNTFRITCLIAIVLGSIANFETVWNLADILMGGMAIVNIVAILLLYPVAVKALADYREQKKQGKDPVFNPKKLGIENTECWED